MTATLSRCLLGLAILTLLAACTETRDLPSVPSLSEPSASIAPDHSAATAPSPRGYSLMTYDPTQNRVYLIGGFSTLCWDNCDGIALLDLWSYNPRSRRWAEIANVGSPDRDALALDVKSRKIVVYQPFVDPIETWAYDLDTGVWENRHPAVQPPARWGSMMVYDPKADRVLLYGGANLFTGDVLGDLWAYDYETNTWTELHPAVSPPPHHYPALAYVPTIDRVVLFGGFQQGFESLFNDTWAYDYHRNRWTNLHPRNPPPPRVYHVMAFEPATNRLVMFGGILDPTNWPNEPTINETWIYDVARNRWSQALPEQPPSPRAWHGMSGTNGAVMIFGGGPSRFAYTSDTYVYSSRSNRWERVAGDGAGSAPAGIAAPTPGAVGGGGVGRSGGRRRGH